MLVPPIPFTTPGESTDWGLRVHPWKFKKKLDCNCCNQSYSVGLFVNKGGLRVHPRKLKKKRLQMLQSELFWRFICE